MLDQHLLLAEFARLERAAQLHDKSNRDLMDSARSVAAYITAAVIKAGAVGVALPQGYQVIATQDRRFGMIRQHFTLVHDLVPPFHSRAEALKLAEVVRAGFLRDLTVFLMERTGEHVRDAETLNNAPRNLPQ